MVTTLEIWEHHIHLPALAEPITGPIGGRLLFCGFGVKESTGAAPAELDLFDGLDVNGRLLVPITLTAGQGRNDFYPGGGIFLQRGFFPNLLLGQVTGSVYVKFLDGSHS